MPARSHPRPPRGHRLRLEPLEDRTTPAYTATLSGSTVTFVGGSSGDILGFDVSGGLLTHSRPFDSGFNSEFDFDSTVAGDQTLAANATSVVNVTTGSNTSNSLQIGGPFVSSTPASSLLAQFNITLGATGQNVFINDANSSAGSTYTGSVVGTTTTFTATGMNVNVGGSVPGNIVLLTSSGGDTVNITGTRGPTMVFTGTGADTVVVTGNAAGQTLTIDTGAAEDLIRLGSNPSPLTPVSGPVIVNGGTDGAQLLVDDDDESGAANYSITSTAVTRPTPTGFGGVTYSNLSLLQLFTGSGADIVFVVGTAAGMTTNIATGNGDDTIQMANGVSLNGGAVNGGAGVDTIDHSAFTTSVAVNLGLNVTGLTATLDGGQENPGTGSTATGTATLSNFDMRNKMFDLVVTVTGLAPADVTGFHFHRGGVGVNGPVVRDLLGLASLVPVGTGFTFTLTGVALSAFTGGVANEAALLGGQLYLNIHTAAAPGGLIRGQVFSTANANFANGTATGTGGIAAIENATGGSAADSLVGSFAANTLSGLGGNDTILGGPGADTFLGGADNDTLIWSNGDNNDVMNGDAGSDTVAVNGSVAGDDVLTVGAAGTRVAFARTNLVPFALDIGTVETMRVNGIGGNDTFTVNSLAGVADLTSLNLFGLAGNDTFTVTPFTGTTTVGGGVGTDTLSVTTTGTTNPFVTTAPDVAGGRIGGFAFGNRGPVNFTQTETPAAPANFVTVTKTDGLTTATAGTSVIYTVTVTNTSALGVNGISVTDVLPAALTGVTWAAVFTAGSSGTAGGSGNINQLVNLAAGGSVTYSIVATISAAFSGTLTNTATATVPAGLTDSTAADNTATDTTVVVLPPPPPPVVPPPVVPPVVPPVPPVSPPAAVTDLHAIASGPGAPVIVDVFTADGNRRFSFVPFGAFSGGATVATGDVTGDGVDDIAVGAKAGATPHVKLFDGLTGTELWSFVAYTELFGGGVTVAIGDGNGDGRADVFTGAGPGGGPHVKAFDGRTGAEVLSLFAYDEAFRGGVSVAAGDVDGDGRAELITGAWAGGGPHVKVLDGRTGAERLGFFAFDPGFLGGVNVAAADLNADGRDELVVGQASRGSVVSTFDGLTAARGIDLESFPGFGGGVSVAATDLDADGTDELLLGAGRGGGPHVRILSHAATQERASFFAFDAAFNGGVQVG